MKIEKGVHAGGMRLRLVLESEDTETHSQMGDRVEVFEELADDLAATARSRVTTLWTLRPGDPRRKVQ